jgi:hypothetical protein
MTVAPADLPVFLTIEGAANLMHCTTRSVRERTRLRAIPMRKRGGSRRVLLPTAELLEWLDSGCDLEVVRDDAESVIVRPVAVGAVA